MKYILSILLFASFGAQAQPWKAYAPDFRHYHYIWADTLKQTANLAYDATTWNGNLRVPTMDAVRDKIESLSGGGSDLTGAPIKANVHIVNDADYTVASTDYIIIYSAITADRTLTIPAASSAPNRMLIIRNPGAGGYSVTLSQTYRTHSSSTSNIVAVANSVSLVSDGTEWWVWNAE